MVNHLHTYRHYNKEEEFFKWGHDVERPRWRHDRTGAADEDGASSWLDIRLRRRAAFS
jgi:hypothetical protein